MTKILQDVLDTPEIRRHTQRIWDLKKRKDQAEAGVGLAIADLGDELIATEAALKKSPDKTAWKRWLIDNVDYTERSADDYMRVAKLRRKWKSDFYFFSELGEADLLLLSTMPEKIINRLAEDPRLPDPKTGVMTPLHELSERDFKKALLRFRGTRRPKPGSAPRGADTKEKRALSIIIRTRALAADARTVRGGAGKLSSATKELGLTEDEHLRVEMLHWPAWVTPQKGRRLAMRARSIRRARRGARGSPRRRSR